MADPVDPESEHRSSEPGGTRRASVGLSIGELRQAIAELNAATLPATVADAVPLQGKDDLLLFVESETGGARRSALHVVPGSARGRVTLTARRFARDAFASGPQAEQVRGLLAGARLEGAEVVAGERIVRLSWRGSDGAAGALVVELFGNRGLWAVLDAEGRIVAQSRVPHGKDRNLGPQAKWQPPPARPAPTETPSRFEAPVLAAMDRHFTAADQADESEHLRLLCERGLTRARSSLEQKVAGLRRQLDGADEAPRLRARADLMLAYAHRVPRGATSMQVPDPAREGADLEIPLQPDKPVVHQAQALYDRARRLTDAVEHARERLAQAQSDLDDLAPLEAKLGCASSFADLASLQADLAGRGLLPRTGRSAGGSRAGPAGRPAGGSAGVRAGNKSGRRDAAEAYRRFVSREGYEILCGKTNAQNDRLTLRTARGNDVWLHVGRGYAGSHVVVRVPKGKSASLETLLDAAQVAVHFSKARGAAKAEVIYTLAKHVRKPKGAAPGQVVPAQTKTLQVRLDETRLRELLSGGGETP
ncbi:MAG: NFACT RNA binding domain-containing protein [Planctomycetota bacterium]